MAQKNFRWAGSVDWNSFQQQQPSGPAYSDYESQQQPQQTKPVAPPPAIGRAQQQIAQIDQALSQLDQERRTNNFGAKPRLGVSGSADYQFRALQARKQTLLGEIAGAEEDMRDIERSRQQIQQAGGYGEGGFGAAFQRGLGNAQATVGALGAMVGDAEDSDIQNIVRGNQRSQTAGARSQEEQKAYEDFQNADGFFASAREIFSNPRLLANVAIESLPSSALSLVGGVVGGAAGAAAGTVAGGPAGTLIGGRVGGGLGSGLGSFVTEYGNAMLETFQNNGVDLDDPEALKAAINDPELMAEAKERGVKRGIAVGVFDGLSAGLAGKLGGGRIAEKIIGEAGEASVRRKVAGTLAGGAAETVTQGVMGGAGEAAGQLATEGRITSPADIVAEFAGEIPGGAVEATIGTGAEVIKGGDTNQRGTDNIATDELGNAIDTIYAGRDQGETRQLEAPDTILDRTVGTMKVRGFNMTPSQILETAKNNESDPRVANILSQPVSDQTKAEQVARIYNTQEAQRVEAGVVERVTPYLDGKTSVSQTRTKVMDELARVGEEVVAESPVLSAMRDAVATAENGKPAQGGKQTLTSLRAAVSGFRPTAPQGQTIVARPQRGGEGSVLMTQDQLPNEMQREREADQAFRLADARQRRYDQATATGEQREDLRPGAAEPQQQIFLNPAVYGEDMAGVEATIVAAETPGMIRIQYPSRSEVGQDGSPVIISEEVSPASLFDRVVRATPRMTQDFASDQRRPKRGVGTEMAGPRNSIDRTSSKAVTTQQEPGAVEPVQPEPNFQYTGTDTVEPVAEQQQELPAPDRGLPAPERRNLPAPEANEQADTPQLPAPEDNADQGDVQFSRRSAENAQPEVAETEQEEQTQEEVTSELDAAIAVVNDALNRLKERGQLGRIAAVRIRSLMKTGSITAAQVKAAFKAADIASQIVKSNAKIDIQFVPNLIDPANGENVQGFFETYQKRDNMPLGGDGFYGVIKLSLSPEWANLMSETAAHEAFHPLQKLLKVADPKTYAALNRSFKANGTIDDIHPSLIRMFRRTIHPTVTVDGRKQTFWDVMKRDGLFWEGDEVGGNLRKWNGFDNTENSISELQAYVFGYYNDAVRSGAEIKSVANQFVKAYELFRQFTDSFGNWLRGNGFTDTTKIFRQAASGELSERLAGTDIRTDVQQGESVEFSKRTKPAPKKTVTAYKLFRVDERKPGQLFPLFVNANDPVEIGQWLDADIGPMQGDKVKSKLGPLAFRPGWHSGDLPIATHIGAKSSASVKKPDIRPDNHVWAEVEMAADRDWQTEANKRGMKADGSIVAVKAHITDQIPEDGFYRYKTNPNMTGNWLIGGSMKVNRILSDAEVQEINRRAGVEDLPRATPFDAAKYGLDRQFSRRKNNETGEFKQRIQPAKLSSDFYFAQPDVKQGENNVTTAAEKIQARTLSILGRPITAEGQQDELLAKTIAHEVKAELARSGKRNASGWYTDEMRKATQVAALIHPEIATDVAAKLHFTAALAITSQNQSVDNNSVYAERWYSHYKKTGKFPENEGWGKAASSIMSNAKLFNAIVERYGADTVYKFFATKFTVREMKAAGFDNVSGAADEVVYGSAILGPKIGAGFYSNLDGRYDPITIDMWFMRTWGRITGDLIGVDPELIAGQEERLANALRQAGRPTNATGEALLEIARAESRAFEKDYKDNRADYDSKKKKKPEVALAAQRLLGSYEDTKDAPKADWQRTWIRNVVAQAQQILQKDGINITNADLQAIIWYPEKRLWSKKFGVREKGKGADGADSAGETSYYDEFVRIAKSRGITDAQIQSAIQPARGRGQGSGSVLGQAAVNQQAGGQSGTPNAFSAGEARRFIQDAVITRLNTEFPIFDGDGGRLARQESGHIVRKAGGNLARSVEGRVPVAATYSHSQKVKNALDVVGIDAPKFYELTKGPAAAKLYHRLISEAQGANKAGAAVYVYEQPEYGDMRLFLTEDGLSGFALKGDDIVSVFKHPNSQDRGVAVSLARLAVWAGGRRLDAFDTILPRLYSTAGFRVSTRMKWNDEYAPANWDKKEFAAFNNGEPDVVFMHYDPTRADFYTPGEGEYVDDYDAAVEKQKADANGGADEFTPAFTTDIADTIGDRQYSRRTLPLERPPVDEDGTIVLDHFSVEPDITENDPSQWGRARTFLPREERQRMGKAPKRTYFGISTGEEGGYRKEFGPERTHYRAKIGANRLYDMANDPDDLKAKGRELRVDNGPMPFVYNEVRYDGVSLYEKLIEDAGYDGYWIKDPSIGLVAAVFKSLRLKKNSRQFSRRRQRQIGNGTPLRPAPQFTNDNLNFGGDEPDRIDNVIYNLQDKLIDLKRIQDSIREQGGRIGDDADVYKTEELFYGRAGKRSKDFLQRELEPLIAEMKAKGVSLEMMDKFLTYRHAKEYNAQIRKVNPNFQGPGSGISDSDVDAYMSTLPKARKLQLEKLAARVDKMVQGTQDMMVEYGLETQATIDQWNKTYKFYVPFQREGFEEDIAGSGSQGNSVRGSTTRRAMGSDKEIVNVLANIALQRDKIITRGERNRIGNATAALALQNPNDSFWFVIDPKSGNLEDARQKLIDFGISPVDADNIVGSPMERIIDSRGVVQMRTNPRITMAPNALVTRINGEDRVVLFNARNPRSARLVQAMKNMDAARFNGLVGLIGKGTRYLAAINTQYNPVFGIFNLMRDIQGAAINLSGTALAGDRGRILKDAIPAAWGMYKDLREERKGGQALTNWSQLAEEFEREGGKTGWRESFANSAEKAKSLEEMYTGGGNVRQTVNKLGGEFIAGWLSDYNEAIENGVRLAAYKAGLDRGLSKAQAASLAKNITVNFNRKGAMGNSASVLYAFFNASVQGSARIGQTLFNRTGPGKYVLSSAGKKIVYGGLMLGVVQALALAATGMDDDIPDWVKDKSLVIPTGDGKFVAIPMPLGYHVIPSFSRRMVEMLTLDNPPSVPEAVTQLMGLFANAFNPIGAGGTVASTLSPTLLDPLIDLASNRDFAGRQIYQEDFNSQDPTPGFTRNRAGTSVVGDVLSRAIDTFFGGDGYQPGAVSPTGDEIDYLIGTLTGGVGREALKVTSTVKSAVTGEDLPLYKVPLVGRLLGNTNEAASISQRFYDGMKEMNGHKRSLDGLEEDGGDIDAYLRKNPEAEFAETAQEYENEVRKLRKEIKSMREEGVPQDEIKLYEQEVQMLMTDFNQQLADYRRGPVSSINSIEQ